MTVWIKQGVLGNLSPNMRRAKGKLITLYNNNDKDFYITSIGEGNHLGHSCHYEENALDFSRQGIPKKDVVECLDKDFDVVEYTDNRDIFHVEYDPKGR